MAAKAPPDPGPLLPSLIPAPAGTPEPRPVIEARWDARRRTWHARAPSSGWTTVPGVWTQDEAAAAVQRLFGKPATAGARIVIVNEKGHDTRAHNDDRKEK